MKAKIFILLSLIILNLAVSNCQGPEVLNIKASKDTYISTANPNGNAGSSFALYVGYLGENRNQRSLIYFSLASIPSEAHIEKAVLKIYMNAFYESLSDTMTIRVHRLLKSWAEGTGSSMPEDVRDGASWLKYYPEEWDHPGGDYDPRVEASAQVDKSKVNSWITFTITQLVKDWHQHKYPNYGLILEADESWCSATFYSREYAAAPPTLEVTYSTGEADFTVTVTPQTGEAEPGGQVEYQVEVIPTEYFTSTVTIYVLNLPQGVMYSLSKTQGKPPITSTLTLTVPENIQPGDYTFKIQVEGGGLTRVRTAKLVVTAAPTTTSPPTTQPPTTTPTPGFDYSIIVDKSSVEASPGDQATITVTVELIQGAPTQVDLQVLGLPPDATYTLNPATLTPTASSILIINLGSSTGVYTIIIQATGGGRTKTQTVTLRVTKKAGLTLNIKWLGIAIAVVAIIVIAILVVRRRKPKPPAMPPPPPPPPPF